MKILIFGLPGNGKRLIEIQGGDSNHGFSNKIHST